MSAIKGRSIVVQRNGVTIAGVRSKSVSINGSSIDTTNDDNNGIRQLLDEPGQVEVSISVSGILTNDALLQEALSVADRGQTMSFIMPGGWTGSPSFQTLSGGFFMSSFSITGEYQGAATFEAEFQSSSTVSLS